MDVFDGCMVAEELAYGCTGIMTAMEASGLGVSGPCAMLSLPMHESYPNNISTAIRLT